MIDLDIYQKMAQNIEQILKTVTKLFDPQKTNRPGNKKIAMMKEYR